MKDTDQALRIKYSAIIRERDKKGDQPVSVLCNKHGITPATFYRWKKILSSLPPAPCRDFPQESFIPITAAQPLPSAFTSSPLYDFRFPNGAALRISGALAYASLSEIIRSVGELEA